MMSHTPIDPRLVRDMNQALALAEATIDDPAAHERHVRAAAAIHWQLTIALRGMSEVLGRHEILACRSAYARLRAGQGRPPPRVAETMEGPL
jgi:hypothetical protein